ncbi:5'-deoxyadenosine deaminase [archaeon MnTg01]|nr:5'-deoxyadenosine deaminase [archaeon MnTg01]
MLLKNASILYGKDLIFVSSTNLKISEQIFKKIKPNLRPSSNEDSIDCEGLLIIPGLINSHSHIGDSIGKDFSINSSVNAKIHPITGAKQKILRESKPSHLSNFMKNTCLSMLRKGITTFVDFREGGLDGILLLKKVLSNLPIRSIILGRLEYYQEQKQIRKNTPFPPSKKIELEILLKKCDGIGISGVNENSNALLKYYSKISKIRAIHSEETLQSLNLSKNITKKTETQRALLLKPHFLVHMTYASQKDLHQVAKKTHGIVICPRANAALAEGIPNIEKMMKARCNIAIGTDNVMINSPDMFREMDYLWKVTMGMNRKRIEPKQILKMATVNAGKLLQKKIGVIETSKYADCVFIDKHALDLEPMHNPYASIVQRASESTIRAVMIGGKIVHGKI